MTKLLRIPCLVVLGTLAGATIAFAEQPGGLVDRTTIIGRLIPVTGEAPKEGGRVDLDVAFAFDSAALAPSAAVQLDELAAALASDQLRPYRILIAGHTDAKGTAAYNRELSERRAEAVKAYLVERHGLAAERLATEGWGEDRLKDPASPEAAINRRVEVRRLDPPAAAPAPATPAARPASPVTDPQEGGAIGGAPAPPMRAITQ